MAEPGPTAARTSAQRAALLPRPPPFLLFDALAGSFAPRRPRPPHPPLPALRRARGLLRREPPGAPPLVARVHEERLPVEFDASPCEHPPATIVVGAHPRVRAAEPPAPHGQRRRARRLPPALVAVDRRGAPLRRAARLAEEGA